MTENRPIENVQPNVQFRSWHTPVEDDDLILGRVMFDAGAPLATFADGSSLSLPSEPSPRPFPLVATFISTDKRAIVTFGFPAVTAYRVVDENGLVELWEANSRHPRPTGSTFRVRGHQWSKESFLAFVDDDEKGAFSYVVATQNLCLEVVAHMEPEIKISPLSAA